MGTFVERLEQREEETWGAKGRRDMRRGIKKRGKCDGIFNDISWDEDEHNQTHVAVFSLSMDFNWFVSSELYT